MTLDSVLTARYAWIDVLFFKRSHLFTYVSWANTPSMQIESSRVANVMSKAAKTLAIFAVYMALTGLVLLLSPNTLLGLVRLPLTQEPWIRVLGMFMVIVGFYYYRAAKSEAVEIFRATVLGRTIMGLFLVYLGLTGVGLVLALFASAEWLGALATWFALRSSSPGST